jgi:hypothetical protein
MMKLSNGQLIREFGLDDFLRSIPEDTSATALAVAAIQHFCGDAGASQSIFRFGVMTVTLFLHSQAGRRGPFPQQTARDLVDILSAQPCPDQLIEDWAVSNFGS